MKFRSRLIVNLNQLGTNHDFIRELAPGTQTIFMVKADGYGHGMIPLVRFAFTELGIREFGCASVFEALRIREELPDLDVDVYVFSDIQLELHENVNIYLEKRLIPVLSNVSELKYIFSHPDFSHLPLCLKFNTGMNRLGLSLNDLEEVGDLLKQNGRKSIYHLMTHYANGSYPMVGNTRNEWQRARFYEVKDYLRSLGISIERTSMANSGAIEQKMNIDETHVRPGLMMYGPSSLLDQYKHLSSWKGEVISRLETYIVRTFDVKKGTPIGYGSTPCPHDGVVAILAIGYGDGFFNRYGGASLYHNGFKGKISGRVNMDMTQVLFPADARHSIKAHEMFTIWGQKKGDFKEFSDETRTSPYEIFCSLLPRVPRVYSLGEN